MSSVLLGSSGSASHEVPLLGGGGGASPPLRNASPFRPGGGVGMNTGSSPGATTPLAAIVRNKRFLGLLGFVLICGVWSVHRLSPHTAVASALLPSTQLGNGASTGGGGGVASTVSKLLSKSEDQIEKEFKALLAKQADARDALPDIERLDQHADRFKVLFELDRFERSLDSTRLNSSAVELYRKSTRYHRDQLFATLYPYISRTAKQPRTFDELLDKYSRPAGIVIPCGNDQFQWAVHLIATLKNVHRTKLPILVVHSGGGDLTVERRAALRSLGPEVETLDLLHYFDEQHVGLEGSGWAIKPFAILASPFRETIICDADAIFLQDPAILLQDPGYQETGTLFFRDREIFPGDGNVHEWFKGLMKGRRPSKMLQKSRWWSDEASREEQESGVVVIDKGRRETVLGMVFVGWLNTRVVRDAVMYKQTYGDKESYWMGYELAGVPYYFDPPYAGIAGRLTHPDSKGHTIDSRICSEHHLHLDYKGRPLWWNGSLFEDKRHREKGWFLAVHFTHGTVDWDCEPEPWCMKGIREEDVKKFADVRLDDGTNFDRVLSDMIGAALVAEIKFPSLIERYY